MSAYIGILEKEPRSFWGIWFPDLPGCVAAGETSDDVLAQVGPAVEQWIAPAREDRAMVPLPREITELRRLPEVSAALSRGDLPIFLPVPQASLGLDEDDLRAVDAAAAERGLTRLDDLRQAVIEKLAG